MTDAENINIFFSENLERLNMTWDDIPLLPVKAGSKVEYASIFESIYLILKKDLQNYVDRQIIK